MRSVRKEIGGLGNLMFKQAYLYAQMRDGAIPDLYVQGESYWKKYQKEVRAMFSEGIERTDAVAVHVRRGDYLQAEHFHANLWKSGYYQKALALFPKETRFIVFCRDNQGWEQDKSDRQWCRDNLGPILGDRMELPEKDNSETQDFNLMASCRNVIGANSSFSWWAAYLGEHDRVVMPGEWFSDGVRRTELPESWILL